MQDIEKGDRDTSSTSSGEARVAFPIPADHELPSYTYPGPARAGATFRTRVQLGVFPGINITREAPFTDADGKSPVFLGSAILEDGSVHPCKIAPSLPGAPCRVPLVGASSSITGDTTPPLRAGADGVRCHLPWARAPGRQPVKGGSESGHELYHAVAVIDGVKVPGKAGFHLGGCNVPFGGREHIVTEKYEILCWRH
ncbi:hypothetical protein EDB84DRAFT_777934 [Lactarius hengduanensis]|nr:hypothetical protein EDB84DRAFT_777934 [Lactarius hengduanensis]